MINQYSFVAVALFIFTVIVLLSWRFLALKYAIPVLGVALVVVIGFQLLLSAGSNIQLAEEDFDSTLQTGEPVFLVLYSNFWVACLSNKPIVDRLEAKLTGHIRVFRIDIRSDLGRYVSDKYNEKTVPAFIVFDSQGTQVWQQYGIVPRAETILGLDL